MSGDELQGQLLTLSNLNRRFEKLRETGGFDGMTTGRLTEMVAQAVIPEDRFEALRLCPGYGDTHVWAWLQVPSVRFMSFAERCDKHPERRAGERRGSDNASCE